MAITREDLKKKRLQAMSVVGTQMLATSDMFDRVIAYGDKVAEARTAAETAQTGALDAQVADLKEMADDLADFGNAVGAATPPLLAGGPPAVAGTPSAALAALNGAQPNPNGWADGDAYVGTHPESKP